MTIFHEFEKYFKMFSYQQRIQIYCNRGYYKWVNLVIFGAFK